MPSSMGSSQPSIKPTSLVSPALAGGSLLLAAPRKPGEFMYWGLEHYYNKLIRKINNQNVLTYKSTTKVVVRIMINSIPISQH